MSLRDQAAKVAQDTARQNREAHAAHEAKMVLAIEDNITKFSGVTATFVDKRSVAYEGWGDRPSYSFGGGTPKVVKHEDLYVFAVDDVLVGVKRGKNDYGFGDPTKYSYDYSIVFEDPQRGSHRSDHSLGWYANRAEAPVAERVEKFVETIARIGTPKHPAQRLSEQGQVCPSCGRDFDEDRY